MLEPPRRMPMMVPRMAVAEVRGASEVIDALDVLVALGLGRAGVLAVPGGGGGAGRESGCGKRGDKTGGDGFEAGFHGRLLHEVVPDCTVLI